MIGGVVVAVLILVLAGIGLVSLLSGDDDAAPVTTLPQLTTTTAPTTTLPPTTTTVPPETHIVLSGESLFSIAETYGVDLSNLIAANPQLTDPEDIDVGDVINVPSADASSDTNTPSASDSAPTDDTADTTSDTSAP